MLRVFVLQNQPSRDGFHHEALVSSLLIPAGCQVKRAWAVTPTDDWSNVQPFLHPWLVSASEVLEFSPDVLIIEGDPGLREIPETLAAGLLESKTVFLYLRAHPFNDKKAGGFQRAGFPLAHSEYGDIACVATAPNDYTVRLEDVSFPGGLWTASLGALSFSGLEARGLAYILSPEEGGFLPLLCAP